MPAAALLRAVPIALGLAYPLLVYCTHGTVPPSVFILAALILIALRWALMPAGPLRLSYPAILIAVVALVILGLVDQSLAALAYPSLISLAFAAAFALSLRHPPSLIERFARLREPDLPTAATVYCARVTLLWAAWLFANGLIAAALALNRNMELWLLWTTLINYLISGALFGGEWLLRRIRRLPA